MFRTTTYRHDINVSDNDLYTCFGHCSYSRVPANIELDTRFRTVPILACRRAWNSTVDRLEDVKDKLMHSG